MVPVLELFYRHHRKKPSLNSDGTVPVPGIACLPVLIPNSGFMHNLEHLNIVHMQHLSLRASSAVASWEL